MKEKKQISDISTEIETLTPKSPALPILNPKDNLLALMIAAGTPPEQAYQNSIQINNPHYHNKSQQQKKTECTKYLKKNNKISQAIDYYNHTFTQQYVDRMQINKNLIINEIHKLSKLAQANLDLKTSLDCLKTIGSELGMFQKNIKIEHTQEKPNAKVIELIQSNTPKPNIKEN